MGRLFCGLAATNFADPLALTAKHDATSGTARYTRGARLKREEYLVHRAIGGLAAMLMFQLLASAYGQDRPGPGPSSTSAHVSHPSDAYLAPGRGIPAQQVEGVYHHWNWMMMLNAGMVDTGADYILFKNGEVWRNPLLPPQDVDIAKAKQVAAADWGTWQRTGRVVVIRMTGGRDERYDPTQLVRYEAAPKNQRVEGSWHSTLSQVSHVGGQSTAGVVTNTLALHADGAFEWAGVAGASFHNGTDPGRAGGAFMHSSPVRTGHYFIDGYTLELHYNDGRVERDLFYWAGGEGNKRYDMVLVNGRRYLGALRR